MENEDEKKTTTELAVKEDNNNSIVNPVDQSQVENLIERAIEKKTPVETMEKLLAMRRELRAEWAQSQFDKAMAAFQMECPVIKKTQDGGKTNSGQVAYKYAPLDVIVTQTKELIGKHGFSYSTKTWTEADKVKVTVYVRHLAGHMESSTMEVPLGTRTNVMSAPQVTAAATTFAKRYAFCNAFGILTGDDDTDANLPKDPPPPSAPKPQAPMNKTTPPIPAQNQEDKMAMFLTLKGIIGMAKTKQDLLNLVPDIEKAKKNGHISESQVSALRGMFKEKETQLQ